MEGTTVRSGSGTKKRRDGKDHHVSNKVRKKKTVRWKPSEDLVEVKIIERVEQERGYYGGSSGQNRNRGYGNARFFGFREGGDASAARKDQNLKGREDMVDWYQPLRELPNFIPGRVSFLSLTSPSYRL